MVNPDMLEQTRLEIDYEVDMLRATKPSTTFSSQYKFNFPYCLFYKLLNEGNTIIQGFDQSIKL